MPHYGCQHSRNGRTSGPAVATVQTEWVSSQAGRSQRWPRCRRVQPSRKRTRSSEEVIHRTANTTARTSLHTAITSDSHHSACNGSDHSAQRSTPRLRAYSSEMTATTAADGNQIGQNGGSRGTRSPWFTAALLSLVESAHTPNSHKTAPETSNQGTIPAPGTAFLSPG